MERCSKCSKKSSVIVQCKCSLKFCLTHRLPEVHDCKMLQEFKNESFEKNKIIQTQNKVSSTKVEII